MLPVSAATLPLTVFLSRAPQIPQFYAPVPPAPAGLIWYKYAPGVPALPTVTSVLGSAYTGYTWIYDSNYASSSFQFSNLDKVRASAPRVGHATMGPGELRYRSKRTDVRCPG